MVSSVAIRTSKHRYIRGAYDKSPDFFRMGIQNYRRHLKIHYVIARHLMR